MTDIFLSKLSLAEEEGVLKKKYIQLLKGFYLSYLKSAPSSHHQKETEALFLYFLDELEKQKDKPFQFELYHQKIRRPFDFYQFGLTFLKPLVDRKSSYLLGEENLQQIEKQLKQKQNVILFANHQTESDPLILSILLEEKFAYIGEKIIYVAGERVIADPLAIPFSMGCDLLCIYSKKYIAHPPEKKREKQLHNQKTMQTMASLLSSGGRIIYVAPSGGRDRIDQNGNLMPAPFDPQSIELFYLMSQKSKRPTHFYPLALYTYHIMPPPKTIQIEMGEERTTSFAPIRAFFEKEFDMASFDQILNRPEKRKKRAEAIYNIVKQAYQRLTQ